MFELKGLSNIALRTAPVSVPLCCCPEKFCDGFRTYEKVLGIEEEFLTIYSKL